MAAAQSIDPATRSPPSLKAERSEPAAVALGNRTIYVNPYTAQVLGEPTGVCFCSARNFNWHNVLGFWSALPLALVVYSGVIISYPWATNMDYRVMGEEPPAPPAGRAGGLTGQTIAGLVSVASVVLVSTGFALSAGLALVRATDVLRIERPERIGDGTKRGAAIGAASAAGLFAILQAPCRSDCMSMKGALLPGAGLGGGVAHRTYRIYRTCRTCRTCRTAPYPHPK